MNKKIIQAGVALFLCSPFILLLSKFTLETQIDYSEIFWALKSASFQSAIAAFFSIVFGFIFSFGLFSYEKSKVISRFLILLAILPSFIPNLFVVVGLLNFIDPFPIGSIGIILVQVFINFGIVAVIVKQTIKSKLGGLGEAALLMGVGKRKYITKILLPIIKADLIKIFFYVFSVTFTSFSVPLLVGGGRGVNLEILVFEKIRVLNNWGAAFWIALLQTIFIFIFSLIAYKSSFEIKTENKNYSLNSSKAILFIFTAIYGLFFMNYINGILEGFGFWNDILMYHSEIFKGVIGTISISMSVGLMCMFFLSLIAYSWQKNYFSRFLSGYLTPSGALTSFAFLFLFPNENLFGLLKIVIILSVIFVPFLYKFGFDSALESIEGIKIQAILLGANDKNIFLKITWPLLRKRIFFLSAMAAFWATGDFAVSKVIALNDLSLAMFIETLMSQYRLGMATVISFMVLILGAIIFVLFLGVESVISRKAKN